MSNGWSEPLIEMSVPLYLGIQGGWSNPLAEMMAVLEPSEVIIEGWKQVASLTATLSPPTIECATDADCPEGYVCVDGMCVRKEAGVPWVVPAAGAAVAAGLLIIYAGKKKGEEIKK